MVRCFCECSAGAPAWKALSFGEWHSEAFRNAAFSLGVGLLGVTLTGPEFQLLASFAFVALVIGGAQCSTVTTRVLGNPVSVFLGEVSFSIYLGHVIVLGCAATAIDWLHLHDASLGLRLTVTATFPFFTLAAAYFTWRRWRMIATSPAIAPVWSDSVIE